VPVGAINYVTVLDYLEIFARFNQAGIRYLVAGGMAVNLHGIPRMTYDIDLIVDMDDENLRAFTGVMAEWGFRPRVPVELADLAVREKREEWIAEKHMKALNLVNPEWAISEIDILIDLPMDREEAFERAVTFDLNGIAVPAVSVEHLILMKERTGRAQDEADVRYLKKIGEMEP
jgi:hypothetical protein